MKLYQIRDVVREQLGGADAISEGSLTWVIERGLREIERVGNWYWMESLKSFSLEEDQSEYSIYTSVDNGLNLPNYKDTRILYVSDQSETNPFWDEVMGPKTIEEVKQEWNDTDTGRPLEFTIKESNTDATLQLWPPLPDIPYTCELWHYQWTALPSDPTSEAHEVLKRWPEALIYLATEQGMILKAKDLQAGGFWRLMFDNPNPRATDMLKQLRRYNFDRQRATRSSLRPRGGAAPRRRNLFQWRNY